MNTQDYTSEFDPIDVRENKGISVLSYFGLLFLIPYLARQNSRFARFHVNQGMVLFIASLAVNVISSIISRIPLIRILSPVFTVVDIGIFVLMIIGIVNAAQGKAKDLPVIGSLRILNF